MAALRTRSRLIPKYPPVSIDQGGGKRRSDDCYRICYPTQQDKLDSVAAPVAAGFASKKGRKLPRQDHTGWLLPNFKTGALNQSATLPVSAISNTPSLSANPQRNRRSRHGVTIAREPRMCVVSRENATFSRSRLILLEIGSVLSQQMAARAR
jgi:hypothetical protein